jgi:hypothetical protein
MSAQPSKHSDTRTLAVLREQVSKMGAAQAQAPSSIDDPIFPEPETMEERLQRLELKLSNVEAALRQILLRDSEGGA